MVLCRCVDCERLRMGDNELNYNPRFFLKHHEFIRSTLTINDEGPLTIELQFSIYGDPLPLLRNVQNEQNYSISELELFKHCLTDLIVGHIFVPFGRNDSIEIEIFYHLRNADRWVPEDSLFSLTDELLQAMTGVFYPDMDQVTQTITYKSSCAEDTGMIMVKMKNEIIDYNDSDFDSPLDEFNPTSLSRLYN